MLKLEDQRAVGFCHSSTGPSDQEHTWLCSLHTVERKKNVYPGNTGRVAQVSCNMSQHRITIEERIKNRKFEI